MSQNLSVRPDVERPAVRDLAELEPAEVSSTPYFLAVSLVGSARIGKSAFSFFANAVLSSRVSTLIMKYATSNARINGPLSRRAWHSAVQPAVKAFGNHASTTVLPRSFDERVGLAVARLQREVGRRIARPSAPAARAPVAGQPHGPESSARALRHKDAGRRVGTSFVLLWLGESYASGLRRVTYSKSRDL